MLQDLGQAFGIGGGRRKADDGNVLGAQGVAERGRVWKLIGLNV